MFYTTSSEPKYIEEKLKITSILKSSHHIKTMIELQQKQLHTDKIIFGSPLAHSHNDSYI